MAATYVLTALNITDTAVDILVTDDTGSNVPMTEQTVLINRVPSSGTTLSGITGSDGIAHFTGLTPATAYTATAGLGQVGFTTEATGYNEPKIATHAQWDNLATRVKAKVSITLSTTDIGEGVSLAANTLYGVYE